MIKPSEFIKWALNTAQETRLGGINKRKPSTTEELNGTLDGKAALQHFNWMFNNAGLWQQFISDLVVVTNGNGVGLTKDNHSALIFAHSKITPSNFILASARKDIGVPVIATISSSILTFGTPLSNGTVPINGASTENIVALSLNFTL